MVRGVQLGGLATWRCLEDMLTGSGSTLTLEDTRRAISLVHRLQRERGASAAFIASAEARISASKHLVPCSCGTASLVEDARRRTDRKATGTAAPEIMAKLQMLRDAASRASTTDVSASDRGRTCFQTISGYSALIVPLLAMSVPKANGLLLVAQLKELYAQQRGLIVGIGGLPASSMVALPPKAILFMLNVQVELLRARAALRDAAGSMEARWRARLEAVDDLTDERMREVGEWLASEDFDLASLGTRLDKGDPISLEDAWDVWTAQIDRLQALETDLLRHYYTTTVARGVRRAARVRTALSLLATVGVLAVGWRAVTWGARAVDGTAALAGDLARSARTSAIAGAAGAHGDVADAADWYVSVAATLGLFAVAAWVGEWAVLRRGIGGRRTQHQRAQGAPHGQAAVPFVVGSGERPSEAASSLSLGTSPSATSPLSATPAASPLDSFGVEDTAGGLMEVPGEGRAPLPPLQSRPPPAARAAPYTLGVCPKTPSGPSSDGSEIGSEMSSRRPRLAQDCTACGAAPQGHHASPVLGGARSRPLIATLRRRTSSQALGGSPEGGVVDATHVSDAALALPAPSSHGGLGGLGGLGRLGPQESSSVDSGTGGDGSRSSADSVEGDVFKLSRGQEQLPAPERTAHATDGPLGPSVPSPRPPLATHADAPPLRVPAAPIAIPPIAATNMEHSCADDRTGGRAPQRIGLVAHRPMSAVLARTEADALANVLDDAPASPCDGNATDTTAWHATPPRQCTDSPRHTPPSTPCHPTAGTTPLLPSRREPSFDQLSELTDLIDDEPQCLDSFEEVATLGQGSFGRAVLMRSPSGLTLVAKQLRLDAKADLVRLDTEVVVLAKLRHRHICQYVHTAVRGEVLNIYIEYAAGGTLSDRIDAAQRASTPFEADVATAWIVQISMAVAYMHSMRVLHRDLSARNIFLSSTRSAHATAHGAEHRHAPRTRPCTRFLTTCTARLGSYRRGQHQSGGLRSFKG